MQYEGGACKCDEGVSSAFPFTCVGEGRFLEAAIEVEVDHYDRTGMFPTAIAISRHIHKILRYSFYEGKSGFTNERFELTTWRGMAVTIDRDLPAGTAFVIS